MDLNQRLLADTYLTFEEAAAGMLKVLADLPVHFNVQDISVWRFLPNAWSGKAGRWTWSLRCGVEIGGYEGVLSPSLIRTRRFNTAISKILEVKAAQQAIDDVEMKAPNA